MANQRRGRPTIGENIRISLRITEREWEIISQYIERNRVYDRNGCPNISRAIRNLINIAVSDTNENVGVQN